MFVPKKVFFPKKGPADGKENLLSDESVEALCNLGDILHSIHQDMVAQGYEIKDGKAVKKLDAKPKEEDTHII
jgi:hypothetical protein